jgi:polysaccharide biosynthesis/export protein
VPFLLLVYLNLFMRISIKLLLFTIILWASFSCVSNQKVIYLQNLEGNTAIPEDQMMTYEIPEYRLQFNDIIDINVKTSEDFIRSGFNLQDQGAAGGAMMGQMAQSGGDIYYMTGFSVDRDGDIRLPIIGEVNVKNLTIDETRLLLEKELKKFVTTDLYVKVKLGGIRFSTLGEFRNPGKYTILQDRMTIFEAIAQAGDLTTVANRDEILLIRQYPEGTKLHRLNLLDRNIISSPFYFIQPNDQIYAQPMKIRELGSGENVTQTLALVVSSISALALVLNLLSK